MNGIHFSLAYLLIALVAIIGICIALPHLINNKRGMGGAIDAAIGWWIIIITILIVLVLGGIFIW